MISLFSISFLLFILRFSSGQKHWKSSKNSKASSVSFTECWKTAKFEGVSQKKPGKRPDKNLGDYSGHWSLKKKKKNTTRVKIFEL